MTDDSGNKSENEIEEGLTNDWWQWKQEWEQNRRRTYKWLMTVETRVRTK